MEIVRNFVKILGITPETELPKKIRGQIIEYSDIETIFVPDGNPSVKSIYEIMINLEIKSNRTIHTPLGKIIVIDGVKKYKIIYTENDDSEKVNIIHLHVPYNTFVELPNEIKYINNIKVYIIDAYFDLLTDRNIYCHSVYLVDVQYDENSSNSGFEKVSNIEKYDVKPLIEDHELEQNFREMVLSEYSLDNEDKREIDNRLIDLEEEYL